MGVGYPVDLVVCSCLGVDMFDCVFATRTARFGQVFTKKGFIKLKAAMVYDTEPLDENCTCFTCRKYSRGFVVNALNKEVAACHLVSLHNVAFLLNLMRNLR